MSARTRLKNKKKIVHTDVYWKAKKKKGTKLFRNKELGIAVETNFQSESFYHRKYRIAPIFIKMYRTPRTKL